MKESEDRYRTVFEAAPLGISRSDYAGRILDANPGLCALLGVTPAEFKSSLAHEFYAKPGDWNRLVAMVRRTGCMEDFETMLRAKNGRLFPALLCMSRINVHGRWSLVTLVQDLSHRKQADRRIQGVNQLLELFATKPSRGDYLEATVVLLKDWCGCQAVGIRLVDQRGRLPFAAFRGFTRRFLKREGQLCLDAHQCACVQVLMEERKPGANPAVDPRCAFGCNELGQFIAKNRIGARTQISRPCQEAGFQSVAHMAIRWQGRLLGSIHLADRRPGVFTSETFEFLESMAPVMGEALHRFRVEESLLESEERFRSMFEKHDAIMLLTDPASGSLMDANLAAAAFYGHSRTRLQALKLRDLAIVLPDPVTCRARHGWADNWARFETATRLSDGSERTVEVHSSSILIHQRRLLFSVMHDVTERKRLQKQIVEACELERQRVGRDLHDSLSGYLTGLALMAKALSRTLSDRQAPESAIAEEIVTGLNDGIERTRAIAHGLCPVEGGEFGLIHGLQKLAAGVGQRTGVACRVQAGRGVKVPDVVVLHLFRIVEEAVQNALRHAAPSRLDIRLHRRGADLLLTVWNDGKPLGENFDAAQGIGLRTMSYRAEMIGARFEIRTRAGGTLVSCLVPVGLRPQERSGASSVSRRRATARRALGVWRSRGRKQG